MILQAQIIRIIKIITTCKITIGFGVTGRVAFLDRVGEALIAKS
jgi:hypothetical protein